MSGSQFDPKRYYRLSNTVNNSTLALGVNATEPPPPLSITTFGFYRSENWQLFYDDGVYFIRNLDYGSQYQLGLNTSDQSTPSMMKTGNGLGMQWNITTEIGDNSGIWKLKNLLVGQANVLALGPSALTKKVPVMNTNPTEGKWMIDINPSAGEATDLMVSPFPSIEGSTEPSTSISTSTSSPTAQSSGSLGGGAIAGIVVGCVAAALITLAALLFFWRSRRQQAATATKHRDVLASIEPKDYNPVQGQHDSHILPELESSFMARAELDAARQTSELPAYRQG